MKTTVSHRKASGRPCHPEVWILSKKSTGKLEDSLVRGTRMFDGGYEEHAHSRRLEVGVAPGVGAA